MKLLIADSDVEFARILYRGFRQDGYAVDVAMDGDQCNEYAFATGYDVCILDWQLSDNNAVDICRNIREMNNGTLVVITGPNRLGQIVAGFDYGADDYVKKPFFYSEISARVRALLRRHRNTRLPVMQFGPLRIDSVEKRIWLNNDILELTRKEYGILECLMHYPGEVISSE